MRKHHRFWNMYLTSTVSTILVLCLIGIESILLLSAGELLRRMKENVTLTAVMQTTADSIAAEHLSKTLQAATWCSEYQYVTADEALEEHVRTLGEDPSSFLGYNPLNASFEIHPTAEYAHPDSIEKIVAQLQSIPSIERIVYQKDLVQLMNNNVSKLSYGLLGIALVLLLIAMVLITNTIRLQIYSKRFLINTMTLVGATARSIKAPYIGRYMGMGCCAALVALGLLSLGYWYILSHWGILLFPLTMANIGFVVGVVMGSGLLLTMLAALIATSRYIRMDTNTLYEI